MYTESQVLQAVALASDINRIADGCLQSNWNSNLELGEQNLSVWVFCQEYEYQDLLDSLDCDGYSNSIDYQVTFNFVLDNPMYDVVVVISKLWA